MHSMLPVHMRKFSKLACHMLPISHLLPLFLAILPHRNELLAFRELCALARTAVMGAKCTRRSSSKGGMLCATCNGVCHCGVQHSAQRIMQQITQVNSTMCSSKPVRASHELHGSGGRKVQHRMPSRCLCAIIRSATMMPRKLKHAAHTRKYCACLHHRYCA